ncbi:MAG: MFS transporter [Muribaculaceae bacterium]|nr:MFS transporter [Muribaculaceae bacterium]
MIKTGKEPIPVLTYIAIMSVCFIINLPGVAVAPIEGKLRETLHTSELEIQLLTTLPNFVIIPFVLIAGKLSDYKHKLVLVTIALIIFFGSGILYLVARDMNGLIVACCLLGVADGILIPFAMGFVVNSFNGKYRTRNLGVKSAVSNFGTVVAGFVIGFLIQKNNWHLPFAVYLVSVVPLIFCYWLKYIPGFGDIPISASPAQLNQAKISPGNKSGLIGKRIWALIGNNVYITFVTFVIVIYLPQLLIQNNMNPKLGADVMAVFFIAVLSSGFVLENILKGFKSLVFPLIGFLVTVGLALFVFIPKTWAMYCGAVLSGWAFGIAQPLIYDKTSYAIIDPKKNIFGLALVLCALYIAISAEPFIITGISKLFKIKSINTFAFQLSFWMGVAYTILSFILRKKFAFSIEKNYYS